MIRLIFLIVFYSILPSKAQKPILKNGLQTFLKANTIYPVYSLNHCIQGIVEVAFKLDKNGKITYATITKGVGADLDAEALRLIKLSSGKWQIPQNYDTRLLVRSPIRFSLENYDCESADAAAVALSIKTYNDELLILNRITEYYKKLEKGGVERSEEKEIAALKKDLDIDDNYIARRVKVAERKIAQSDFQSACEDLKFVKYLGSSKADKLLMKYCK